MIYAFSLKVLNSFMHLKERVLYEVISNYYVLITFYIANV